MKHIWFLLFATFLFGQYDFSLEDLNPSSEFYGESLGTAEFPNEVRIVYFGYFYWGLCTDRFGELNDFYNELVLQGNGDKVKLFGVGKSNHLSSLGNWINPNDAMVMADSSPFSTWNNWDASQRDLYILDAEGNIQYHQDISSGISNSVYNLIEDLINEIEDSILGDVNQDGIVNIVDIVQTVNMVLGTIPTDDLADINNDNQINIVDIVNLVNMILGNN